MNTWNEIKSFKPKHKFFVGVDSDGTVFDTMEIKHKQCFIPIAIDLWNLGKVKEEFTEICEQINLYSETRGINRFLGLEMAFQALKEKGKLSVDFTDFSKFLREGREQSNQGLIAYNENAKSDFLEQIIEWCIESDRLFDKLTDRISPFPNVKKCLAHMAERADIMVVSSASDKGLSKDWGNAGVMNDISIGAGQSVGSKREQIQLAADGKYEREHIFMIGDAPGDMEAVHQIGGMFYPILAKREAESWGKLFDKYFECFVNEEYRQEEQKLIEEFRRVLL